MYPFLQRDDLVVVKKGPFEGLRPGCLVVFREGEKGHYTVHRFIKREKGGLVLVRGDGYGLSSQWVKEEVIIGRAAGVVRGERFIPFTRFREWVSWALSYPRRGIIHMRKRWIHGT